MRASSPPLPRHQRRLPRSRLKPEIHRPVAWILLGVAYVLSLVVLYAAAFQYLRP
jgi:hypothetical protein